MFGCVSVFGFVYEGSRVPASLPHLCAQPLLLNLPPNFSNVSPTVFVE